MNFLEKIDYLMGENGLNKSTLSQASKIPYTTIDAFYKKGYENAKLSTIQKLADYFDTTLDYLMREEITDINYGKTDGFIFNYEEMNHIKKYRSLDDHGKEMVDFTLLKEWERSTSQVLQKPQLVAVPKETPEHLFPKAAHNNDADSKEQQELMEEDFENMKNNW